MERRRRVCNPPLKPCVQVEERREIQARQTEGEGRGGREGVVGWRRGVYVSVKRESCDNQG